MSNELDARSSSGPEKDGTIGDHSRAQGSGVDDGPPGTGQESGGASAGMGVGAGIGGVMSYDPTGPISTSMDDSGGGEGDGGGDGMTAEQRSTGGRSVGPGESHAD